MAVYLFGLGRVAASILFCAAISFSAAAGAETDDPGPDLAELAGTFRRHCVRVYVHGKTHEGKPPAVGDFPADIRNERPTPVGGYWWDDRHVVIADPGLQDHFIRSLEIGLPYSDQRFPARVAGRFIKLQSILLEVLPNDLGALPRAHPLEFSDGDLEESVILSYVWEDGEWRIKADGGIGAIAIADSGLETVELKANGVFLSETGAPLGLAFGDKVTLDPERDYWCGRELSYTPLLGLQEDRRATRELRERLGGAMLETRFRLRVRVEDDDDENDWALDIDEDDQANAAEIRAAGMVVGRRHLFVPFSQPAEGIARIEEITVHGPDGRTIPASFAGAFRDYLAVLIETSEDIPDGELPPGFTMLNPLVVPNEVFEADASVPLRPEMEYIRRWRIDYSLGRRREVADYDRWLGTFRGYRGDATVLTLTNEEDGALAFDVSGRLAAVALTPRVLPTRTNRETVRSLATPAFRPLDFLYRRFHESEVFDPAMVPVDEEMGRRLVDFGVEFQGLDANTSRLFSAAEATRGGQIGLLVTHVYPGSLAAGAGIREHDILLRMFLEGRSEPSELRGPRGGGGNFFDGEDMSSGAFQQMLALMPPPWPARDNAVSALLTAAGVGRKVEIDYLREGEARRAAFVTAYTAPDYRNARREKFAALGLTVKPVTYEVGRYFRRTDGSGVIVSRVEEGGKSSVAGLHQYLLITHVDGGRVAGVEDFRARIAPFEEGRTAAVELTVEGFGKTRLVKIE